MLPRSSQPAPAARCNFALFWRAVSPLGALRLSCGTARAHAKARLFALRLRVHHEHARRTRSPTSPRERDRERAPRPPARSSMASTCLLSLVIVVSGSAGDRPALRHASRAQLAQGQGAGWLSALAEAPGWAQHDYANLVALPVLSGLTFAALRTERAHSGAPPHERAPKTCGTRGSGRGVESSDARQLIRRVLPKKRP